MASKKRKRSSLLHPLTVGTAGTVLLLGWHMHALVSDIPRERVAAYPPQTLAPALPEPSAAKPGLAAPVRRLPGAGPAPAKIRRPMPAGKPTAMAALPLPAPPPRPASEDAAPLRGPQWEHAPLPAFSPEMLRAMMDPRAARRARRLRRLGIVLPDEPVAAPHRSGPPTPAVPDAARAKSTARSPRIASPAAVAKGQGASPARGTTSAEHAAGTQIARLESPESSALRPPAAAPAPAAPDAASSAAAKPAAPHGETGEGKPAGESERKDTAAPAPAAGPPVRLQARLDHPRTAYRVGEWVALRFLASRPVHLRVYRVDPAGRVTRVFSTYGREDAGSPARTFSMMVKAGEPKPGQEGMIAIGSTRPLTHEELLSCLRASLADPPAAGPAPAPAPSSPGTSEPSDRLSPADTLKAVIEAVGRAADTPDAAPAPLDRSGWSVAVGQFTSAPRKLSDDQTPLSRSRQSARDGMHSASG